MDEAKPKDLNDLPELMDEKTAGMFLHKSPATMWRLRKNGEISFRRMGGIYYLREDIIEFLTRCKRSAK
jgi:hypothetical protein